MRKRNRRSSTASCAKPRLLHDWRASDRPPPNRCARESPNKEEPAYVCTGANGRCRRRFKDGFLDRSFTGETLICQQCINDEVSTQARSSPSQQLG